MATVTDHENARWAIVDRFHCALSFLRSRSIWEQEVDAEEYWPLCEAAFETSKRFGWDYENDQDWQRWTLKATQEEILTEGLRLALGRVSL